MSDRSETIAPFSEGIVICGVRVVVGAPDRELLDRLIALLPPGFSRYEPESVDQRFVIERDAEYAWHYIGPRGRSPTYADLTLMISLLEADLRRHVAERASDGIFVHAGAVAYRGQAILIPGDSFSGKTTLVAELVRAGAEYYSDEFAIIDDRGLVHPFARPLSIRRPPPEPTMSSPVESLGGTAGLEPVPVGVIAATQYRPDASFDPERRSTAQGILALLAHASRPRDRPGETIAVFRKAASTALVLEGDRGEAADAAQVLLELADRAATNGRPRPLADDAPRDKIGPHEVAFEVYGTRVRVAVPSAELAEQVAERIPLHAVRCEPRPGDRRFAFEIRDDGGYAVIDDGVVRSVYQGLESGLDRLRFELFYYATHNARDHLVISAAAVAHEGRAIVLPGLPKVGKTILLAGLLRAGAVYYADDWAVLNPEGLLRPFPTTFRLAGRRVSARDIGATVGEKPIQVGVVARITFKENGRWGLKPLSREEGAEMLAGHSYGMANPPAARRIGLRAAAGALFFEGERNDVEEAAAALLEIAARAPLESSA